MKITSEILSRQVLFNETHQVSEWIQRIKDRRKQGTRLSREDEEEESYDTFKHKETKNHFEQWRRRRILVEMRWETKLIAKYILLWLIKVREVMMGDGGTEMGETQIQRFEKKVG